MFQGLTQSRRENASAVSAESDEAAFTRLGYIALARLSMNRTEVGLLRFGHLLDLIECWRQEVGVSKPRRIVTIDDVIPVDI